VSDIAKNDHVIIVRDMIDSDKNVLAETKYFNRVIRITANIAKSTISGANQRTIAHELGHTFKWRHPNDPENKIRIKDASTNIMTQTGTLPRGSDINSAIKIEVSQLNAMILNYNAEIRKKAKEIEQKK
jgi:hypothetical protein